MADRMVYVGIFRPAPDNPPRHPTVEHVFATEAAARRWADEYNDRPNRYPGTGREVWPFKVER